MRVISPRICSDIACSMQAKENRVNPDKLTCVGSVLAGNNQEGAKVQPPRFRASQGRTDPSQPPEVGTTGASSPPNVALRCTGARTTASGLICDICALAKTS